MDKPEPKTAIQQAVKRLREIVLDSDEGIFVGSEEALIATLGCSRSTVRQAARLLEREGLLRVRRGINGGYFGARPDARTIQTTVSAYLETLDIDPRDVTILASALWVETVRKAAKADRGEAGEVVARLRKKYKSIKDTSSFDEVRDVELASQADIFALSKSLYVKLIFDINVIFSRRTFSSPINDDDSPAHKEFVRTWRDAKLLELNAIAEGDDSLAIMASQYTRKVWHRRIALRFSGFDPDGQPRAAAE